MGKRKRSSSSETEKSPSRAKDSSFSIILRDKRDIRPPDRLNYHDRSGKQKGLKNGTTRVKKTCKRSRRGAAGAAGAAQALPSLRSSGFSLFSWTEKPRFIERQEFAILSSGDAHSPPRRRTRDEAAASSAGVVFESLDEEVFAEKLFKTRQLFCRIFSSSPPLDPPIPVAFWRSFRPCDRFLLLKRLVVIDVHPQPVDYAIVSSMDLPDSSEAKKILRNLCQLHLLFSPVFGPNDCYGLRASMTELHSYKLHPLRRKSKKDVTLVSVNVPDNNRGRLEIVVTGDVFRLELWTDDADFTRFSGRYLRHLLPSLRTSFRATASVEDSLWQDPDFAVAKSISIKTAFSRC